MRNFLYTLGLLSMLVPTIASAYYCYFMFYEWAEAQGKYELSIPTHGVDRTEHENPEQKKSP